MMKYRREVDGLRAIAVLPVILFHAGFSWFSGGYVGVDIFFVISGYLITTILINDLETGNFSIAKFYERRARRILPALLFMMLCCIPFAYMWMLPEQLKNFSQAFVAISLFSSNILFWQKEDYFAPAADNNPLLHTWSLAVEEQYYIVFPVMLFLLWRFGKNRVFYAVLGLTAASLLLSELGWRNNPSANFYLLPTRAWELGVGAACGFILSSRNLQPNQILSALGLLLILLSIFRYDETTPFPSLYTLVPVGGTALIILYGSSSTLTAKLLSTAPLVGVGLVSFSAYLWHQPLLVFARLRLLHPPSSELLLALSAASIILAYFSWRYVEKPFREKKHFFSRSRAAIFGCSLVSIGIFLSIGFYGHLVNGAPERISPSGSKFSDLKLDEMRSINYGLSSSCRDEFTLSEDCRTGAQPSVALWGDSYAMHLAHALMASASKADHEIIQFTKSSCSPVLGIAKTNQDLTKAWAMECLKFKEDVTAWLLANDSVKYVLLSSPMGILFESFYDSQGVLHEKDPEYVLDKLREMADVIRSAGKKPVFISPPPRTGHDLSHCPTHHFIYGSTESCAFDLAETSEQHREVMLFLEKADAFIPVVNLESYLCRDSRCETLVDGINLYRDSGHFSRDGAAWLGREFDLLGIAINAAEHEEALKRKLTKRNVSVSWLLTNQSHRPRKEQY